MTTPAQLAEELASAQSLYRQEQRAHEQTKELAAKIADELETERKKVAALRASPGTIDLEEEQGVLGLFDDAIEGERALKENALRFANSIPRDTTGIAAHGYAESMLRDPKAKLEKNLSPVLPNSSLAEARNREPKK